MIYRSFFRIIILFLMSSVSFGDELKEVLSNNTIKVCKTSDEVFEFGLKNKFSDRQLSLYIPPFEASQAYQQGKLLIIDVRDPKEYAKFRIPDSINLPVNSIQHKSIFKKKRLLLINNGKHYKALEAAAQLLLEKGFVSVKILDGGIKTWKDTIRLMDGQAGLTSNLKYLGVREFLPESQHGPWLIVDVGDEPSFKEKVNGEIKYLKLDEAFAANLNSILREELNPLIRVLFVSNQADFSNQLEHQLKQVSIGPYHVLKHTTDYIDVLKRQSLLAHKKSTRNLDACGYES